MNEAFIRQRITSLRSELNISEYRMSTDLGHSTSYIHSITSGKALPSMSEFLYICRYLGVSPKEFFDDDMLAPQLVQELYDLVREMPKEDLEVLIHTARRLNEKK